MVHYTIRSKGKSSFPYKLKNIIKQFKREDYNYAYLAAGCMPGYKTNNPFLFNCTQMV